MRRNSDRNLGRLGFASRAIQAAVLSIDVGRITVVLPSAERIEHTGTQAGPSASIIIRKWRALRRLATGGDLGFAEAYIDGDWTTPDLEAVLDLAARNIDLIDEQISGSWPMRLLNRIQHVLRANSRTGSRKNIAYHYDLGNAFYKEWLDACRGGKTPYSNFDIAAYLTEIILLGCVALRVGKKLEWDGPNMRAKNAPEAAQFVKRQYRKGWTLG